MSNKITHWIPNEKKIYINANYYVNKIKRWNNETMKCILYHVPKPVSYTHLDVYKRQIFTIKISGKYTLGCHLAGFLQ